MRYGLGARFGEDHVRQWLAEAGQWLEIDQLSCEVGWLATTLSSGTGC